MARRTGVPTIQGVAKELCRLVTKFTPVIAAAYPSNSALLLALDAANAACAALVLELETVREYGD
jgi:hypothetical protein